MGPSRQGGAGAWGGERRGLAERCQRRRAPCLRHPELARLPRPDRAFGGAESSRVNTASALRLWPRVGWVSGVRAVRRRALFPAALCGEAAGHPPAPLRFLRVAPRRVPSCWDFPPASGVGTAALGFPGRARSTWALRPRTFSEDALVVERRLRGRR